MTTLENINELKSDSAKLYDQLKESRDRVIEMQKEYNEAVLEIFQDLVKDVPMMETVQIKSNGRGVIFYAIEGFRTKDIFQIYIDDDYRENIEDIRMSYYSTSEWSEFEAYRLFLLGHVSKLLWDNKRSITRRVQSNYRHFVASRKPEWQIQTDLESKMREIRETIETLIKEDFEKELMTQNPINLEVPVEKHVRENYGEDDEEFTRPAFRMADYEKGRTSIQNITSVQIKQLSPRGVKADIEVLFESRAWDGKFINAHETVLHDVSIKDFVKRISGTAAWKHKFIPQNEN